MSRLRLGLGTLSLLAVPPAFAACGNRSEIVRAPSEDAGADASDAGSDAKLDAPADAPSDAELDSPLVKPGLGEPCENESCAPGLECYHGEDTEQTDRWPEGYCTVHCSNDSTCTPYGGICGGEFQGSGVCYLACAEPTECRQGYACRPPDYLDGKLGCAPTGFIATRGPGIACQQHDNPNAPHFVPGLTSAHFTPSDRMDLALTANEVAMAISPGGTIVGGANARDGAAYDNPSYLSPSSTPPLAFSQSAGPKFASAEFYSDPYLVSGKDGTFYYSTIGLDFQFNAWILVAHSVDQGATWQTVAVNPDGDCSAGGNGEPCMDHPWLAIGPDKLNPTQEAIYAAYLTSRTDGDSPTVIIRSTDGGKTWGLPGKPNESLEVFSPFGMGLFNNLITPTVDANGVVHMVTTGIASDTQGSVQNGIFYARSDDGGATRSTPLRINPIDQPVPFDQAVIRADAGNLYVVYTAGDVDGAWDVILAKSADNGASWTQQKVNDEPEECATHFHPTMAIDAATHQLYVAWYDGRFAPYEGYVAMSTCDPGTLLCAPNEAINDVSFFITTDRQEALFIGDYFTLQAQPGGTIWAAFGDTRENVSHAYLARGMFP